MLAVSDIVDVVAGFLVSELPESGDLAPRVLLAQRWPTRDVPEWSERWCLPGGKVDPGETDPQALIREWREELTQDIKVGPMLCSTIYRTEGYKRPYRVSCYLVAADNPRAYQLTPGGGQATRWCRVVDTLHEAAAGRLMPSTQDAARAYTALRELS